MIVVTLTDCPPALRGDLSKWLLEINTGVYIGQVNARVRDKLWQRITQNIKHGRATMVFDAQNEQRMDFRIHNTSWEIVDCDGIRLVRRPSEQRLGEIKDEGAAALAPGFSNAARYLKLSRVQRVKGKTDAHKGKLRKGCVPDCTVVDLETTGLDPDNDTIIEVAALRVRDLQAVEEYSALIRMDRPLPESIVQLTGITDETLEESGIPLGEALQALVAFMGNDVLLIHNASFDLAFLEKGLARLGLPAPNNKSLDTCRLARKAFLNVPDYKLSTLAGYYKIEQVVQHRALDDCKTALEVFKAIAQTE